MGAAVTWVKACVGMAAVGARLRMCCAGSAVCVSVRVLPVRLRPWTGVGLLVSPCGIYAVRAAATGVRAHAGPGGLGCVRRASGFCLGVR